LTIGMTDGEKDDSIPFYSSLPLDQTKDTRLPFCTECGGKLRFDRKLKQYACESCGITYTDAEILDARDRLSGYTEEDEKKRKSREYLDWWFKSKKKA